MGFSHGLLKKHSHNWGAPSCSDSYRTGLRWGPLDVGLLRGGSEHDAYPEPTGDGRMSSKTGIFLITTLEIKPMMIWVMEISGKLQFEWHVFFLKYKYNFIWLVVWNIFFHSVGNNNPNRLSLFRGIGVPPTSHDWIKNLGNHGMGITNGSNLTIRPVGVSHRSLVPGFRAGAQAGCGMWSLHKALIRKNWSFHSHWLYSLW